MRTEALISKIYQFAEDKEKFEELRRELPLGVDMSGEIVRAQKRTGIVSLFFIDF